MIPAKEVISALYRIGAIQFGQYAIKRDFVAPFQVDLTPLLSETELAREICKLLWEKARKFEFDMICGLPTIGALIAGFISWEVSFPMVAQRLDGKEGVQILGKYKSGQRCLLFQDILGFGGDTLAFVDTLEAEGLTVIDSVGLIDLEMGGKKRLKTRGIAPHCLFGMKEVIEVLHENGKIPGDQHKLSTDFLESL